MSRSWTELTSHVVPLCLDDVDTDQIIPARFLKVTDKSGLAEGLFAEWRKDPSFVLHRHTTEDARILLAGKNFGCGSSREHAPWALLAGGFSCVIARSFGDIFMSNALKNGLLTVPLDDESHAALVHAIEKDPKLEVRVSLEAERVEWHGRSARFSIDRFARRCLLEGIDPLGYLLAQDAQIRAYEERT